MIMPAEGLLPLSSTSCVHLTFVTLHLSQGMGAVWEARHSDTSGVGSWVRASGVICRTRCKLKTQAPCSKSKPKSVKGAEIESFIFLVTQLATVFCLQFEVK